MFQMLNHLLAQCLPLIPKALMRPFAMGYVAGETVQHMVDTVRRLNQGGCLCTVDLLGEFIHHPKEAEEAANQYHVILDRLHSEGLKANVSVKLSQMGLLLDPELCYRLMDGLVSHAQRLGNFVRIDMEDSSCTTATIQLYLRLREQYDNVGIVLQAYLRRTLDDAQFLMASKAGHFRLCKGIYREPRALAYPTKSLINKNYVSVLEAMVTGGAYVGIATHDEELVWEAERLIRHHDLDTHQYEFQMLLGVDEALRNIILARGHRLRVYVPFGEHWHAYCIRRFKENPVLVQYVLQNLWGQVFKGPKPGPHVDRQDVAFGAPTSLNVPSEDLKESSL